MPPTGKNDYPTPDTLVAILPNTQDFALAQRQHWYRIPCRSAPETLPQIQWLAFYHTAAFGDLKWAVHFVAPVRQVDRVSRRDLLPGEPGHPRASDPYFCLRIGELAPLKRPVPSARRRRVVFIPTTLAKLLAAHELNDLYHESPLEDQLWTALRRADIAAERQFYVSERRATYCLDFAIPCRHGDLDVECDGDTWHLRPDAVVEDNARNNLLASLGWSVLRFSSVELTQTNIPRAVNLIRETSERLGGIELPDQVNRRFNGAGSVTEQLRLW